ncbi:hypothetical protein [Streptomyces yangpuensis]|uniref:hypothetical protein n=1 Tax=Streptomyces yangpuensis TaxID=1648182 RepID=UPI000A9D7DBA|nr:hypothetical protein [Streptomyces yangpuensis]
MDRRLAGDRAAAVRPGGAREYGQVYPVTLTGDASGLAVLRWTIPPYEDEDEHPQG